MQNTIYVGISGQISLERRMAVIAQNMANINTAGFRAEGLKFEQMVSPIAQSHNEKPSFVTAGKSFLTRQTGVITQTGNAFDVAIKGEGWLALETANGIVYTKDGRMAMSAEGDLISVKGYNYLDDSSSPIQLDPKGGDPVITRDGKILQNGNLVARLGLYQFPQDSELSYREGSSVVSNKAANLIEDFKHSSIMQGFIEGSNVNGVTEMTRLIEVSRAFERMESLLRSRENQYSEAVKILGSRA